MHFHYFCIFYNSKCVLVHFCNSFVFVYTAHLQRKRSTEQRRFVCTERRSLRVYSSRKMRDDIDMYNGNDSDEEIYTR